MIRSNGNVLILPFSFALLEVDDMWPENILWTDEAHLTLEGAVNTQNCRKWGSAKPLVVHQRPLHSAYVTVGVDSQAPLFLARFSLKG